MEQKNDNIDYPSMDDCMHEPYPSMPGHVPAMPLPTMPDYMPSHPPMMPMPGCPPMMPMPDRPGHVPAMPLPMPTMPIDEEHYKHMKKMYYMHMHMAHVHKAEAYKHKMMYYEHDDHDC